MTTGHRAMPLWALGMLLAFLGPGQGVAEETLPTVKGKRIVATVQGEHILLDDLQAQLAGMRSGQAAGTPVSRADELAVLKRMIDGLLIVQEARRMDMQKLPEVRQVLESDARVALREALFIRVVKDVKPDAWAVEEAYRASVREWKVAAAFFEKEEHARSMEAGLKAGQDFDQLVKTYVADGRMARFQEGTFLRPEVMAPNIAQVVSGMTPGSTSPVVPGKSGFLILKFEEVRYPDDPAARARAEQKALQEAQKHAFDEYDAALRKKHVKVNQEVLKSIDYGPDGPGFEALRKDRRVLAEIKGEKPLTVGDLTEQTRFQFFHGSDPATVGRQANAKKAQILDEMLHRRLFRKEALRLGLDKTEAYKKRVKRYEDSLLFGMVVQKIITPGVRVTDEELRAYYTEHRGTYTAPEMIRLKSLAFGDRSSAESARDSLAKGADFQWVASRAAGQLDPGTPGLLSFGDTPVMTSEMPEGVQKVLAGVKPGDARLYASPDARFYVLGVQTVAPAAPMPFEQVKDEIFKKVLDASLAKAVEEYAGRLRELSDVKVHLRTS